MATAASTGLCSMARSSRRDVMSCVSMPATIFASDGIELPEPAFLDLIPIRFGIAEPRTATTTCRCCSRPTAIRPIAGAERWRARSASCAGVEWSSSPTVAPVRYPARLSAPRRNAPAAPRKAAREGDCGACTVALGSLRGRQGSSMSRSTPASCSWARSTARRSSPSTISRNARAGCIRCSRRWSTIMARNAASARRASS